MMAETITSKHQLPSKLDSLIEVEKIVDQLKEDFDIPEEIYGNILVSLSEAANNAIKHGNQMNPDKNFIISFLKDEQSLKFSISDEGAGFDYENIPDPTHPDNIDKPFGRGIFIMKNLADLVEFHQNGKKVELTFNQLNN